MQTTPPVSEHYPLPIPQAPYLSGPILLKDGTPAELRRISEDDLDQMRALLERCSIETRTFRFFQGAQDTIEAARRLIQPGAESDGLTLGVFTGSGESEQLIAIGSFAQEKGADAAQVAFLVDDAHQGRGIGTLLLERLAMAAAESGLRALEAHVMMDNQRMLQVFADSGFQVEKELEAAEWRIRLPLVTTRDGIERMEERDRLATKASMFPFFHPRSIAVVGASRNPKSIGHRVLTNLVLSRFQGPVYPINPNAEFIASIPAYPSVKDVPGEVDLAVISVPQPYVLDVVDDCAEKGVKALIVLTAGFAETGEEGRELQDQLVKKVRGAGMRMIGPNCLGLIHTDEHVQMNATFAPMPPPAGRIAMSSQSGALGLAILEYARDLGVGLSAFVSVGNKADISGNDLLQWWEDDPHTDVILLYLESFGNPKRFARLARRIGRKKPIVAVKGGRTAAGQRAAGSHTAALATNETAVDALFRQTGVIRTATLDEMFDISKLLAHQPLPPGKRAAILTNAGGPGILCADACEAAGLTLPPLDEKTRAKLAAFLPAAAGIGNPVDMVASASAEQYRKALQVLLEDDAIDSVIVIFIPTGAATADEAARAVKAGRKDAGAPHKPVLACFMVERGQDAALAEGDEVIPSYRFPEAPAFALARAAHYAEWRNSPLGRIPSFEGPGKAGIDIMRARDVCRKALRERGPGWLTADETAAVLDAFGIPTPTGVLAKTADEAVEAANRIGFPVVVKLASTTLVHKTEWKGVHLDLTGEDAVRNAFELIAKELSDKGRLDEMDGVLVQPMVKGGAEVFLGVTHDPMFGPLVAFGLGGTTVELLGDVTFSITPLTDQDAHRMIRSIKGYRLLEGYRGSPPSDVEAAEDILLRVSRMVEEVHEISELDINPLRLLEPGRGALALDARIHVRPDPTLEAAGR